MKYLFFVLLFVYGSCVGMQPKKKDPKKLVIAAWRASAEKAFSNQFDIVTIKPELNGRYGIKHICRPKGMQETIFTRKDVLILPWSTDGVSFAVKPTEDSLKLIAKKSSWYSHPLVTHSTLAVSTLIISYFLFS